MSEGSTKMYAEKRDIKVPIIIQQPKKIVLLETLAVFIVATLLSVVEQPFKLGGLDPFQADYFMDFDYNEN